MTINIKIAHLRATRWCLFCSEQENEWKCHCMCKLIWKSLIEWNRNILCLYQGLHKPCNIYTNLDNVIKWMHLTLKRWRVIIFKSNRAIIKWKKIFKLFCLAIVTSIWNLWNRILRWCWNIWECGCQSGGLFKTGSKELESQGCVQNEHSLLDIQLVLSHVRNKKWFGGLEYKAASWNCTVFSNSLQWAQSSLFHFSYVTSAPMVLAVAFRPV